ncbi:MAG: HDOD domain-containing protein [Gammaproteobacteria bacterium]|nr:HDOD domain-containing protein [Gammaproteobacteria bacterium]
MQTIGRFRVGKKLGAGAQGSVFLCLDPDLQRKVAIKVLNRSALGEEQDFLREARAISQIQHPNIVSIYDVGKQQQHPYLVFEYVEGELLSQRLQKMNGDIQQKLDIFGAMLSGIDQVHRRGIVHRDLKPSNVIIGNDGLPKIMDFGISRTGSSEQEKSRVRTGTPRYMAPEYIASGEVNPSADVFALGAILFEMLTGKKAFDAPSRQVLLASIRSKHVPPPSELNSQISEGLDAIVLKALEKEPAARYRDAGEMLGALVKYRESGESPESTSSGSKGTIEFLLRRMQHKSDFPVLSESIRSLNQLSSSEEQDVSHLASVIIRDFALTNKILKVVNSAYYSRFAGKIGSVSRAIVVLGIKTIRSIAASLIFFEHLHNRSQATRLKEEICAAVFGATLSKQAATDARMEDIEGTFLCGMMHNMGRILVAYYLTDESEEIERLEKQEGMDSEGAQRRVLGMTFEQIGIAIAKQWNFPKEITLGMARVNPKSPGDLKRADVKTRLIASFANEAAKAIGDAEPGDKAPCRHILKRYRMSLAISDQRFEGMVERARDEFMELSSSLAVTGRGATPFVQRLIAAPGEGPEEPLSRTQEVTETCLLESEQASDGMAPPDISAGRPSPDAELIMTEGLQEVTAMMLDEKCNVSQIFNVVLETIYRAMAYQHVVLCLQDVKSQSYAARLGFGEEIESFMQEFKFPSRYSNTVFHVALKNGVDLYIEDCKAQKIQDNIPEWYTAISHAGSFILLPLLVNQRALGMIYADHPKRRGVDLSGKQLNLLKALRNQLVLAFRARP